MTSAVSRLRTNVLSSCASNVREIPCISVVAAEVVAQTASPRPTIVMRSPLLGDSVDLWRLSLRSVTASAGIAPSARWIRLLTSSGLAMSEKTPRTTRNTDGMARNSEYASA